MRLCVSAAVAWLTQPGPVVIQAALGELWVLPGTAYVAILLSGGSTQAAGLQFCVSGTVLLPTRRAQAQSQSRSRDAGSATYTKLPCLLPTAELPSAACRG